MGQTVEVIGAPADYGASRRGVDMGPSAIRYGGLAEQLATADVDVLDAGDLPVRRAEEAAVGGPGNVDGGRARYLPEIEDICTRLADRVHGSAAEGHLPLVLGGDHSIAIGTLHGLAEAVDGTIGLIWFDAHGDFNTPETTPSGNVHGMSLAAALGRGAFADREWARTPGLHEENVALVGLRDLDPGERVALRDSEVSALTMSDIDEVGLRAVIEEALRVAGTNTDAIHVSLDLDWLDPSAAPGVGTPIRGGVTYREAHSAMEAIASYRRTPTVGFELVEVNPTLDTHNETAELAAELAASAMGKRVL